VLHYPGKSAGNAALTMNARHDSRAIWHGCPVRYPIPGLTARSKPRSGPATYGKHTLICCRQAWRPSRTRWARSRRHPRWSRPPLENELPEFTVTLELPSLPLKPSVARIWVVIRPEVHSMAGPCPDGYSHATVGGMPRTAELLKPSIPLGYLNCFCFTLGLEPLRNIPYMIIGRSWGHSQSLSYLAGRSTRLEHAENFYLLPRKRAPL
jgi:hypothetical protein